MLDPFGPEIWSAEGGTVNAFAGFHYPTRMAVIRLRDGSLLVWSPVHLTDDLRQAVVALGPVRHIVAPNSLHHLFVAEWLAAFPGALLHGAPGLAAKRPDLPMASTLGDTAPPDWSDEVDQVVIRGNLITTEVVFWHRASATVLVTDLIQHLPPPWFQGWRGVVARLDMIAAPQPEVPRKFRAAFVNRAAARQSVTRLLDWPARGLIMAHGPPIRHDAASTLRRIFGWLMD